MPTRVFPSKLIPITIISCLLCACAFSPQHDARRKIEIGNRLVNQSRFAEAAIVYEAAAEADPWNAEPYYRLGLTNQKLGDPQAALAYFRKAFQLDTIDRFEAFDPLVNALLVRIQNDPLSRVALLKELEEASNQEHQRNPSSISLARMRGRIMLLKGNPVEAEAFALVAVDRKPDDIPSQVLLGEVLLAKGEFGKFRTLAESVVTKQRDVGGMYPLYYRHLIDSGDQPLAGLLLDRQRKAFPDRMEPLIDLARHHAETKQQSLLQSVSSHILNNYKTYPQAHHQLGKLLENTGYIQEAIETYEAGLKVRPAFAETLLRAIVDALTLGTNAKPVGDDWVDRFPDSAYALAIEGFLLQKANPSSGIEALSRAAEMKPSAGSIRMLLGRAEQQIGDLARAEKDLQFAVETMNTSVEARLALANVYIEIGKLDRSLGFVMQAIEIRPRDIPAHRLRARILILRRMFSEADISIAELRQIEGNTNAVAKLQAQLAMERGDLTTAQGIYQSLYKGNDSDIAALEGLLDSLRKQNLYQQGLSLLIQHREKHPTSPGVSLSVANWALWSGDIGTARKEFEALSQSQPENAAAWNGLGQVYMLLKETSKAEMTLNKSLQINQNAKEPNVMLASIYNTAGNTQLAIRFYEKALAVDSADPKVLDRLAFLLADTGGNLNRASDLSDRAYRMDPKPLEYLHTRAWIYYKRKQYENAIVSFRQLIAKQPANPMWHSQLGLVLKESGKLSEARKSLQDALLRKPSPEERTKILNLLHSIG